VITGGKNAVAEDHSFNRHSHYHHSSGQDTLKGQGQIGAPFFRSLAHQPDDTSIEHGEASW
jgi:hypothetical protein